MKRRTKKLVDKFVAIMCTLSMLVTGMVSDLGVMNVMAEEDEAAEYRTEWSFRNNSELFGEEYAVLIQKGSEVETANVAGLKIDTTSGGKFQTTERTDWALVSAGTIITIPVAGPSKVTITAYSNVQNFSVDGQVADAAATEATFVCEGTDNKVTLTVSAQDYLGSIVVKEHVTVEEGTIDFITTNLADAAGISTTSMADSGSGHGLKTTAYTGSTMTLTLAKKANVTVTACRYGVGVDALMEASSGKVSTELVDEGNAGAVNAPVFTVTGADAGELTLSFTSEGNCIYIHSVAVEYVEEDGTHGGNDNEEKDGTHGGNDTEYRTVWDFRSGSELIGANGVKIQNTSGTFADLNIDATASGAKFDATLSDWAQVNAGTIIEIPVAGSSKVTIEAYAGANYTVDGQVATAKIDTFICEGADNKVTLLYTANDYLGSITVEPYATVAEGTTDFSSQKHDITTVAGVVVTNMVDSASGHGLQSKAADATMVLSLAKKANVTVTSCVYGVGVNGTMVASSGDEVTSEAVYENSDGNALVFTVPGADAGDLTLTFASNMYIHEIVVEYVDEEDGNDKEEGDVTSGDVGTGVVAAGTINFAYAKADDTWDGIVMNNVGGINNSHGVYTSAADATMVLTLSDKANITVTACCYGAGVNGTMTASTGTVETSQFVEDTSKNLSAPVFTVLNVDAGELTLTFANNMYIHSILVEYIIETGSRNIDVWDFGGKVESDEETYTNNITPEEWLATDVASNSFPSASYVFGDLTLVPNSSDRIYTNIASLAGIVGSGTFGKAQVTYSDGYTSAGTYYCNGAGGTSRRYVTISNVKAGDKIVAYMGVHGSDKTTFYFEGLGAASGQKDAVECASGEYTKFEFVAEKTGTYKIWEAGVSKHLFHRVMRIPGVAVSGTITAKDVEGAYTGTEHGLMFVNQSTQQTTVATIDGSNFTATLAPGYTYTAVLTGVSGYGFTADSRTVVTTDKEYATGKSDVALVIEPKEMYTYSGKITGFAEGYDVSGLEITMTPPENSTTLPETLTIDKNLNFTVSLEPDVDYTIEMSGVNDYEITSDLVINKTGNYTADITVDLRAMYAVTGGFIGLGEGAEVTALIFENVDDAYPYTATVNTDGYSINLRDGSYLAKATVSGYSTQTHVVVNGAATTKDLMFVSTAAAPAVEWVSDIYVGYPDKTNNYATVNEAVAACAAMGIDSEPERVTIHIAPGTYREQVVVETPYISFVNDTAQEVLLTWYYGIDYLYYSANAKGYYDPEKAYDKFERHGAAKWGAAVYVYETATAFRADGITFENSFNRYLTEEELADGVKLNTENSDTNTKVERNYSLNVKSKAATERAAALVVESDMSEFKDCIFLGSQDTVMTGNAATKVYFKNCFLEGQTDYIFGSNTCIFDNCELSWYGYSDGEYSGYITAARPADASVVGYLFRNCSITANDGLTVKAGYLGRPWGADAKVMFLNTRLENADLILAEGWASMSSATPENADFYEYNTTDMSGTAVDTASRKGKVADADTAATWTMANFFGDWIPSYYTEEAATVEFATAPFVTDNGDINTPYPGHKLTVGYSLGEANDANDASRIQWYRVKEGEADVLVKASSANADKTYKITLDDVGYQIKVVVTPITVSGNTGTAASCTVVEVVREGYEDPDATGPDAVLGDGVNIFLAGDSTVKDYSATGLKSSGKARNEGAWGEFFQKFFNEEKVTVVNHANGGRSSRNFINEGSLDKIAEQIDKGDYLFIQFGHNDCADGADYLADRYVPLGTPDANGIYPTTAGTKVATPTELSGMGYGDTCYTYDCGGTYKWYLLQYINVAKEAGATPVLVTPVSRMYYNSDGTIKAHHDSSETSNNAYVTAVKQLAEEENVLLVDGFELTKKLFEDAYTECGSDAYGKQIMHTGDKTHNNKLGGLIEAAAIASVVQNMDINISYAVKSPAQVLATTTDSQTVFSINGNSVLTAYDITSDYAERATYWEGVGQNMFKAIADKAEELAGSEEKPGDGDDKDTTDGNDKDASDGEDKGTGDGNDKGTGDGNDKPVNTEGFKVRLADPNAQYVYTGSAITPAIVVTNNGERLVSGVDYTVKYTNNVNTSVNATKMPTITVTGKGNIAGAVSTTFEITQKDIADSDIVEGSVVVAKGSKASPILLYKNKLLGKKDFTNADAAKTFDADGTMTITGQGNFKGTRTIDVKAVDKKDLKKLAVTVGKEKLVYNGQEQVPTITVTDKKDKTLPPLEENKDYIIVYGGSKANAGTVKFTVVGLGYYSGTVAKSYKISPLAVKDISQMEVTGVNAEGYEFLSKGVTIGDDLKVTYKAMNVVLTEGKDYKISYSANKKVGTAKYTIKFQGNFKGSKPVTGTFKIVAAPLSDATAKVVLPDQIYKGKPNVYKSKPIVDVAGVTLKASNYTVKYYTDAEMTKEVGKDNKVSLADGQAYATVYVKIEGKGNYAPKNGEFAKAEYRVYAKDVYNDLSKAKVTFVDANGNTVKNVAYTGNELEPAVKVECKVNGAWVTVPADQYEVSYTNNVNRGKMTVVVTGTGKEYAGSKTAKTSIVAKSLKDVLDLWK